MSPDRLVLLPPLLIGSTVTVRPWESKDAAALSMAWSDPDVIAGSDPPDDRSVGAAQKWIEGAQLRAEMLLAVDVVIAAPEDDRLMGEVGLSQIDLVRKAGMIGWWVAKEDRGRHVGTDGVSILADWALQPGRLRNLIAEIAPQNRASKRVAENAGFRPAGPVASRGTEIFVRSRK